MITKVLANFILGYGVPTKAERKRSPGVLPGNGGNMDRAVVHKQTQDSKTKQVNAMQAPEDPL